MIEYGTDQNIDYGSDRIDEYEYVLVDPFTLNETGETVPVVDGSGSITYGTETDNIYSCTFQTYNTVITDRLVRIKHTVTDLQGNQASEVLGTFFVEAGSAEALHGMALRKYSGYSTLYRLTQDVLAQDFSRPTGYVIVDEVRELVEQDGGLLRILSGVDEDRKHTVNTWWEVGTNKASVLEQLAGWTDNELGVDDYGYITWGPRLTIDKKALKWTFSDVENSTYKAGFTLDDTSPDAVNRVVAHFSRESKRDGDAFPLADSVTVDLPDTNAFSYRVIGRRKTYDLQVSDPCSHTDLQIMAQAELDSRSGSAQYYTIEHVGIASLRPGDKVRLINTRDATRQLDMYGIVQEISMKLDKLNLCKTKIRV